MVKFGAEHQRVDCRSRVAKQISRAYTSDVKRKVVLSLLVLLVLPVGLLVFGYKSERPLNLHTIDPEKLGSAWSLAHLDEQIRNVEASSWDTKFARIRVKQEKLVYWATEEKVKTPISFVSIHGFSAGPLELEPTIQKLALRSKANLFVTRLTAHGLENGTALRHVKAEEWISDSIEAFAIGHAIGDKVVAVGMSTGASLALLATAALKSVRPDLRPDGLILLSPNFKLANRAADALMLESLAPFTDSAIRLIEGNEHSFMPKNELHRMRWTSRYPIEAVVQLMRVLRALATLRLDEDLFSDIPRLLLYTPKDKVVSIEEIERRLEGARSAELTAVRWENGDQHQLASRTFSSEKIDELVSVIDLWVKRQSFSVVGRGN